jgi:hypothetical protein
VGAGGREAARLTTKFPPLRVLAYLDPMVTLQVIVPIIVAVGGVLAWFAFHHPRDFRTLGRWIIYLVAWPLIIGGAGWSASNHWTHRAVMDLGLLKTDQIYPLADAMDAVSLPWWWFPAIVAGVLYVGFLGSFPAWISDVGNRYRTTELDPKKE